jgi:tyrosyl-tRNA synthetase
LQLAFEIVRTYHSPIVAQKALEDWHARFSEKRLAETELPRFSARDGDAVGIVVAAYSEVFATSKSRAEASRLIKRGSVQIDGEKIVDPKSEDFPAIGAGPSPG